MKIAIVDTIGTARYVMDHGHDTFLGTPEDKADGYFLGQISNTNGAALVANSCVAAQRFAVDPEQWQLFLDALGVSTAPPITEIYALFNGREFSDWLEISHSQRFMNSDVGPEVGFTCGTALKIKDDLPVAIPQFPQLQAALAGMGYRGQVLLGITKNFELATLNIGHFFGHFSLFCEMAMNRMQDILEFIFGEVVTCPVREGVAFANLVTKQPFPSAGQGHISAPKPAESHLWRMFYPVAQEKVLITAHGIHYWEARVRVYRTLDKMRELNTDLQYRTDFFRNDKLLFTKSELKELSNPALRRVRQSPLKHSNSKIPLEKVV